MTKGTSAFRRGFCRVATRTASSPGYRQSAPAKAASILRRVLQKEAATYASATRQVPNSVVKAEHLFSRSSADSQSVVSPVPSYGMVNRKSKDKSYGETNRRGRSYASSHGPKRQHGDRGFRSYGTRHVIRSSRRHVRSYGTRRANSYGERRLFSYGDRHRRKGVLGRERLRVTQRVVQHGRGDGSIWDRKRVGASDKELISTGVGTMWVAGYFLNTFTRNLYFGNLPAILKVKYQLAGNEFKSLSQAQAVWESIPAQVRVGGPGALRRFHKGKDWSHIIPKSKGGPSTADNAIWWSSEKNRSLGANPMSLADIADARAVMRTDAIRASIVQTASSMVQGAIVAVVVSGALACIECGLDYAEGKITWRKMVQEVVGTGVIAGGGAFVTTGIIVGISLLFPFLIPMLTPVLFVLQVASLAFMGAKSFELAKGWWTALERQQLHVPSAYGETVKSFSGAVKALPSMSRRKIYRTGRSLTKTAQALSGRKTERTFPWKANQRPQALPY